ncbi:MAG: hypothetical protein WC979_04625 [Candidatus Pacearchaeota archaeon]|jgi:ribosome-binding protein aMBF1 (putative translation factor)
MEICARCGISEDIIKLYDAIYEGQMARLCERCVIIENLPVIRQPNAIQVRESEKGVGVYERMRKIAGLPENSKKSDVIVRGERLNLLNKNPNLEKPTNEKPKLIEHFYWEITRNRRRKGLSQQQLADTIHEPVIIIEMLEQGKLPEKNSHEIIRKLENLFQMRLKKVSELEVLERMKIMQSKPVLLDSSGNRLEQIPEPEIIENVETVEEKVLDDGKRNFVATDNSGNLDLRKTDSSYVTVNDLKDLHKKRIEVSKQEMRVEQKRIEERERIIEARKEELRLFKEKESDDLDNMLGGAELLGKEDEELEDSGFDDK